jgi:hypothetical protein
MTTAHGVLAHDAPSTRCKRGRRAQRLPMPSCNDILLASVLLSSPVVGLVAIHPVERAPAQVPVAAQPDPRPADARALFEHFARMPGLQARFTEEKHLSLLALPLESRGVLYFLPPGHLTRIVESPTPTRLSITPAELRIVDPDREEVIDLHANDQVRVFVTSLLGIFAGDRAGLERSFAIEYTPDLADDAHWRLRLTPRAEPLVDWLSSLELSGAGTRIERIELREPNGDRTLTKITSIDPLRVFSAEEKRDFFGLKVVPAVPAGD